MAKVKVQGLNSEVVFILKQYSTNVQLSVFLHISCPNSRVALCLGWPYVWGGLVSGDDLISGVVLFWGWSYLWGGPTVLGPVQLQSNLL